MTTRKAPEAPGGAGDARLAWADQLRAVAIVLVVFLHVCNKHFTTVDWPAGATSQAQWTRFNDILWPLLMPSFFLVSGFFASRSIAGPWPKYAVRALRPYYLYVVWLVIFGAFFWVGPTIDNARFASVPIFLSNLVYPQQALWFLYALALFFVVAKVALPIRWLAVAAAVVGAIKGPTLLAGMGHWPDISENAVYFLVGAYAPWALRAAVDRAGTRDLILSGIAFLVTAYVWQTRSPDFIFGASWAALWFALNASILVSRNPKIAELLAILGARTLAIYVIHLPIVAVFHYAFRNWLGPEIADAGWLGWPYPVVVATLVIALSLAIETGLRRAGASWLFDLPRPLERAVAGRPTEPVSHRPRATV